LPRDVRVARVTFTPDGKYLVASSGPVVSVWEWPALKLARTVELPKPGKSVLANPPENSENHCDAAAVSPDGKWLLTVAHRYWYRERDGMRYGSASDGIVDLWDFTTGKYVRRLVEGQGTFQSGMFTADGRFVLIGAGGTIPAHGGRGEEEFTGELNLLDPAAGRWVRTFDVPPPAESV